VRSLVTLVLFAFASAASAENWPQWRGPANDGVSPSRGVATTWSETENVHWKLKLPGWGSSTPAIWDDKIFLTSQDGDDLVLMCINKAGKEVWRSKIGTGKHVYQAKEGNDASPSPSTDGKHVYVMLGTGEVACFDFEGKSVWSFDAQKRYGKFNIQFGMHSTPVLHGDHLYLQILHTDENFVVALDKKTGADVWKVKRVSDGVAENLHSYASPFVWTDGEKAYLVTHGNDYTIAYSLQDGAEIWRLADLNPKGNYNRTLRFVASPVVTKDLIVVPTAKRGAVVALRPGVKGKISAGGEGELWRIPKGTPDVPSPLVHDGLVYLNGEQGTLTCLDAKTGKEYYSEKVKEALHRASPVYADGKIYMTSKPGTVSVVQAGKEPKVLARNELKDTFTASPAISNGVIYLRGWESLYAIRTGD
jgi:outer membrane protein assembly factor BamB